MMPTIRIEDDVFQGLKSIAEPFTDTPNAVIRRLLEDRGILPKTKVNAVKLQTAPRAANTYSERRENGKSSSLTPQPIYEEFLLHVLATNFNGRAGKHEATKAVLELMKSRGFIGPADIERVKTGETKAENTIAWGRNALKDRGLISRLSPRGIWELTPEGVEKGRRTLLPKNDA